MSSPTTNNTNTRRIISSLVVMSILAVFLSIYFLKYVPNQKHDYNRRAFVELGSVTDAFNRRDQAYLQVVKNIRAEKSKNALDELLRIFPNYSFGKNCSLEDFRKRLINYRNDADATAEFARDSTQQWNLVYTVSLHSGTKSPVCDTLRMSKSIDSLVLPLVSGGNDVFDTYLLILDNGSPHKETGLPKGEIVFNPGQLSLDYLVNIDTLLKKSDGFSLPGINNVTIEGNAYKLFLFPFRLHQYRAIMAGLVSTSRYTQQYEEVPVAFITTGAILLLLLMVALPLLKIYIISPTERITNLDLRMVIGAYFVGGFVLFFLFAWNFLADSQKHLNKTRLQTFAHTLQDSLTNEIHATCAQLRKYDTIYRDSPRIRQALKAQPYDSANLRTLHPEIYKQFDVIFWVGKEGRLNGRYAMMRYRDIPLVSVSDRDYFNDLRSGHILTLPIAGGCSDSFCLQPTLDRLDGGYVVNIVIPCHPPDKRDPPIMVGSSGQPWSIYNTALPPGYGFSIVDAKGTIFFDSRKGRHLLSNIASDISDDGAIAQCINYRKERFFPSSSIHGSNTALLITPLEKLPYVAIVYYEREASDKFLLYILGLTAFFVGSIIALLVGSTLCNEWALSKPSLSGIPPVNFDWLRPKSCKLEYYKHLLIGMGLLGGFYLLFWNGVELFLHRHEFALFVISVLFPFYLAIHYFLLREKQKYPKLSFKQRIPPAAAALAIPLLVIFVTMIYVCCNLPARSFTPMLIAQLFFAGLIAVSLSWFTPPETTPPHAPQLLHYYSWSIIAGVITIIVIPALGIFCFFYKEETRTTSKEKMLAFASTIECRKNYFATVKDSTHYLLNASDTPFVNSLLKYKGVYYINSPGLSDSNPSDQDTPVHHVSMYYGLRNFLFPKDTTILTFGDNPDRAEDFSWYFARVAADSELLVHKNTWTGAHDSVRLPLPTDNRRSALKLLTSNIASLDRASIWLFILTVGLLIILFRFLTSSMASRIFLLRVLTGFPPQPPINKYLANPTTTSPHSFQLMEEVTAGGPWSAATLKEFERHDLNYRPLYVRNILKKTYDAIWSELSPEEKFVLFDFALDGLTNYKAGTVIFALIQRGILFIDSDGQLQFMTHSFHNYVIGQAGTKVIAVQLKKAKRQGSWQHFRVPVLLVIAAAGIFIFVTQEAMYQKITGLFTSLSTLLPLVTQFFDKGNK